MYGFFKTKNILKTPPPSPAQKQQEMTTKILQNLIRSILVRLPSNRHWHLGSLGVTTDLEESSNRKCGGGDLLAL